MAIERTYTIPLRPGFRNAPAYYRTNKAVRTLRLFLAKHMKVKEENVKLGQHLNLFMWDHGIKNPPPRVTVHVVKGDDGIVKAELEGAQYTEAVRPRAKSEEPQGLREKIQSVVGGKKDDDASADEPVAAEKKEKKTVEKKAESADENAEKSAPKKAAVKKVAVKKADA